MLKSLKEEESSVWNDEEESSVRNDEEESSVRNDEEESSVRNDEEESSVRNDTVTMMRLWKLYTEWVGIPPGDQEM